MLDDEVMVPVGEGGRQFTTSRLVRLGDASPGGRLRFDALARMVQDIATDDANDVLPDAMSWVVRRVAIEIRSAAVFGEMLTFTTFCGGIGSRWAQRRTSMTGSLGAQIEVAALWVHVDLATLRPTLLDPKFIEIYSPAAAGRAVRSKLHHDDPPSEGWQPFTPRFVDFDLMHHMNNATYWNMVEEELACRPNLRHPMRAEIEYRQGIERTHTPSVVVADESGGFGLWYCQEADGKTTTFCSARVTRLGNSPATSG